MTEPCKDFLGLHAVTRGELESLLASAESFYTSPVEPAQHQRDLAGTVVALLFYEPSTRTRISFERAAKRLGAETMTVSTSTSSIVKGESLADTVRTLEALGAHIVVLRHPMSGAPHFAARKSRVGIVNAGDGTHEHPTQALIDLATIRRLRGSVEGLHVVIVGDVAHSRVARSNVIGLGLLGARVTLVGPATLLPPPGAMPEVDVADDLDRVLPTADVVCMLRIQHERQPPGNIPSAREYRHLFGLTRDRLRRLPESAVIMHPGPANVGVEIDAEVLDDPRTAMLDQVKMGVAVRMAVLASVRGGVHVAPHS